ncbi:hypothetical protein QFC19_008432 [Naganishia cerealis]|uniref:Uncharacterized protein n=1 Tax=Naganishia cerealis TaxID=610337 RepID=A0ACC2V315_9TREE|nr:hypothetical protein QFC19_008432 [Naganishia cerealis]
MDQTHTNDVQPQGAVSKEDKKNSLKRHLELFNVFMDAYAKDQKAKPKKICTEHPNSNTHDTKECLTLRFREMETNDTLMAELAKQLQDINPAKANVAQVSLGQAPGDASIGGIAVVPTALVNTHVQGDKYDDIDSAATEYMVHTDANLHEVEEINEFIQTGGNNSVLATNKGNLKIADVDLQNVL